MFNRNVIKSSDKIKRMENEIEDITAKLSKIKEEKKILSADGAQLNTSLENVIKLVISQEFCSISLVYNLLLIHVYISYNR